MRLIEHARAVASLFCAWLLSVVWLWPHAVRAGTLSADLKVYDWTSLGYAAVLGFLGGVLALIVALASDHRAVTEVLKEGIRNAIVSPIAGAAMFLAVESMTSASWFLLPPVGRFLLIGGSGWAGIAFFIWMRGLVGKFAVWAAEQVLTKLGK